MSVLTVSQLWYAVTRCKPARKDAHMHISIATAVAAIVPTLSVAISHCHLSATIKLGQQVAPAQPAK
jgi:hypothetical protein